MNNTNQQMPATTNQIQVERPNVEKITVALPGDVAGSFNGGHYKVIACLPVMQGQPVHALRGTLNIQTLTPLSPAFQKLRCTLIAAWCPHSAVWENWEEFYAQKGGTSVDKIPEIPNFGGKELPYLEDPVSLLGTMIYNTQQWRDSFISSYIPRLGSFSLYEEDVKTLPAMSALGPRGYIRIYNDLLRNKEFDEEITEYKSDIVTDAEMENYIPTNNRLLDFYYGRAKRDNSYYTNYRTELQGFEASYPPENMSADSSLINWMVFEQMYSSAKKEALDSQRNAWDILAEERGSTVALQGKPCIVGKKSFYLNYSSITQNAYNNNEQIAEKYRVMGYQGGFSYTNIDMPLIENFTPEEEGNIHLIAVVTAETVYESGINRQLLNIKAQDIYRPENAENKHDVLLKIETCSEFGSNSAWLAAQGEAIGFKRRYSEYFSLVNNICGDMTTEGYWHMGQDTNLTTEWPAIDLNTIDINQNYIESNNTYQFYERSPYQTEDYDGYVVAKKIWKDYSDFQINKNLAIPNKIRRTYPGEDWSANDGGTFVDGQNQIFYVGKLQMITTMSVNPAIKNDFLRWGEH